MTTPNKVVLNRETATEYVLQHLTDLAYEDIRILRVTAWKRRNHPPMVTIWFAARGEMGKDFDATFDVWIEGDKLYGEW